MSRPHKIAVRNIPGSGCMKERKIARTIGMIAALLLVRLWLVQGEAPEQEPDEALLPVMSEAERFPKLYAAAEQETTEEEPESGEKSENGEEVLQQENKVVYLTFDDGPSKNTGKVLDVLTHYGIKATFFVIGKDLSEEGMEQLKRAAAEGHVIGMHTYCHDYRKIYSSVDSFLEDYDTLRETLEELLGESPSLFRFPGGSYCTYCKPIRKELIEEMTRRGYTYYDWNVSAEDSVGTVTRYSIRKNIFPRIYEVNQPIVLMHDSPSNGLTAELLPEIIEELLAEGYRFSTLKEREPLHFGENYR